MNWLQTNWQIAACIAAASVWLLQTFGKTALQKVKSAIASAKPALESKTTIMSAWPLLVIALMLGPKLLPQPSPVAPVEPDRLPDIVDQCNASGRALLADALADFASKKFDTDQAREDAINEKIGDVVLASFEPLGESIAKAITANRVTDCADKIRKGDLRE
jgi:hypothetical protein